MARSDGRRLVLVAGIVAAFGPGEEAAAQTPAEIVGRVVAEGGNPVAGAAVRLYRRGSYWDDHDEQVEVTKAGADGSFRLDSAPLPAGPADRWNSPTLTLVADHPGHAVGWKTLPRGTSFRGEIRLAAATADRTIAVVDGIGRPLAGATVAVTSLGDSDSPAADLREPLFLQPLAGPLTAITDAAGRARFRNLPPTPAAFQARKPGFAANVCFRGETIHLTPAATLGGILTGPDGRPLPGVTLRLMAGFIDDFEVARTDNRGRYRFDALPARGWDKSEFGQPGTPGDGSYKLWVELPLQNIKVGLAPKFGDTGPLAVRSVRSDARGQVRVDRVIPGLTYHSGEDPVFRSRPRAGVAKMEAATLEADLILAPE